MASSEVKVTLMPKVEVTLVTDNPNIGELVDTAVLYRDSLDISSISVTCEDETFDAQSFTEIVRDSIKQLIGAIELERGAFDKAILSLETKDSQK